MEVKRDKFSKDYLQLLEYDKLLDRLSKLTPNEKTKKLIYRTKPVSDLEEVKKKNREIDQFIQIFIREGYFPLNEYPDITEALNLLSIEESVLSPKDLLNITSVLLISRQIKNFLVESVREKDLLLPLYKNLFSSRETEKIINDSIDPSGMVKDSASRDLRAIRTGIKEIEHKIIGILENMVNSYKYSDVIQEKLVTVRKGRYVIPVKQNFSSKIKGIIHDRSSSGQTIYLEPVNVVELNNKLSDLKIREHIEVRKILKFLTDILRKKIHQIRKTFDTVVYFDYLYTKAKFAKEFKCTIPEVSQEINLLQAKHPIFLLDKKEFKPLDIKVGNINRGLVITGPNTGGKTVFLKTLGLISVMFQSGIPVPVSDGSKIDSNAIVDLMISEGNDNIATIANQTITTSLLGGDDTISTYTQDDTIHGNAGNDTINAGDGENIIYGDEGDDILTTGSGDDEIYGGSGTDSINAGSGADTIDGGDGDDIINGNAGADVLKGGSGDDVLTADDDGYYQDTAYADTLEGGKGDDTLKGGAGDDVYIFNRGDGKDTIYDNDRYANASYNGYYNAGNDTLKFGEGITQDDLLITTVGNDLVVALKEEGVEFADLADKITITNWYNTNNRVETILFTDGSDLNVPEIISLTGVSGPGFDDTIDGTEFDDVLYGTEGNNSISAKAGDDIVYGNAGNDVISGGAGDDTIYQRRVRSRHNRWR